MIDTPSRRELLVSGVVAMLSASCSTLPKPEEALSATRLPDLPRALGGQFAGTHKGALLVAGGSYFETPPWHGGVKQWVDTVYALPAPDEAWRTFRLPRPLGYGASISTAAGLLLIGGGNSEGNFRDVLRIRFAGSAIEIEEAPPLPVPLANCLSAELHGIAYVVGGQESPSATAASSRMFSLRLQTPGAEWQEEAPVPGPARILPAVAAANGKLCVVSGAGLEADDAGMPRRTWLRDAWCFSPGEGWSELPPPPRIAVAAPAIGIENDVFIFGGDDGANADKPGLRERHPGFPRDVLRFDIAANSWSVAGSMPVGLVTTTAALWNDFTVIPGGEERPAHRSGIVYGYRFSGGA